ncbi:peptidase M50 [Actinomyces radicidentis]|uniref:Peptidase M50 n=1 Tax=Actinomyces radicidentis TaxID=111015 RepID=A0A0X8JG96_ACTRD|nr:site-2 protease family protein [Actinomyces radicidentis]AMD88052.1 peptidase M50 [Actinomyces radicidentis]
MPSTNAQQGWVLGRIGGAPVVVAPTSAILGLIIAASWFPLVQSSLIGAGLATVLLVVLGTVLGVAVSVMLHELAHGLTGTALGRRPVRYELYLWGGQTTFGPARGWRPWKDVLTSLAGPATNLLLWFLLRRLVDASASLPYEAAFTIWAVGWVNLALAVFNALPGLPLDGGHALAALVEQVTGSATWGLRTAAVGGLLVVVGVAWHWVLEPLVLAGQRPDGFGLILAVMVAWPIAQTSWRVLGLGRGGSRAARRLDLTTLMQPVAVLPAAVPLTAVRERLDAGAGLVLVVDGERLLGTVDDVGLAALGSLDESAVAAGAVCTVLPQAAVSSATQGEAAAEAMRRARAVSRWLVVTQGGSAVGAVPTGAR